MARVTVLGSGAWGTTLGQVLCDAGNEVLIWGRNHETIVEINSGHTNARYLPNITLPRGLKATGDANEAFAFSDNFILAIPAQDLRSKLNDWAKLFPPAAHLVSTVKGIEVATMMRMTEVVHDVLAHDQNRVSVITGPNLASELALRQPAGAVAASRSGAEAEHVQALFNTNYYRVYTSTDLLGCELAGAVKSVIALAVGISIGMEFGENTQSMLITRGLNEVARLGAAHGASPLSAAGLAGMGDLVASCGSGLSRNRTFGEALGRGGTMAYARENVARTVEGVASAGAVVELAHRVGVEVPIIEAVADVVRGALTPRAAMERLMSVSTHAEEFIK